MGCLLSVPPKTAFQGPRILAMSSPRRLPAHRLSSGGRRTPIAESPRFVYRPGVDGISFTVHPWVPEGRSILTQRSRFSGRRPRLPDRAAVVARFRSATPHPAGDRGPADLPAPPIEIRLATFSCGSDRVPFISAVARVPFDRHGKAGEYCKPRRGAPCAQAGRPAGCRAGMPNCSYGHAPSAASACNWPGPRGYTGTAWSLLSCQLANQRERLARRRGLGMIVSCRGDRRPPAASIFHADLLQPPARRPSIRFSDWQLGATATMVLLCRRSSCLA